MTTQIIQTTECSDIPDFHSAMADALREPEPPTNLPVFTTAELSAMHRYCLKYRALVRGGGTPTQDQDERFMLFQQICYAEGVAHG